MKKHPLMDKAESTLHSSHSSASKLDKNKSKDKKTKHNKSDVDTDRKYPYLVSDLYAIAHFDPRATDQTKFGPSSDGNGRNTISLAVQPIFYGGPVNIMTYATTHEDTQPYMWQVGTDRVSYVKVDDWKADSSIDALHDAAPGKYKRLAESNFNSFIKAADILCLNQGSDGISEAMSDLLENSFNHYQARFGNGLYAVVSKDNILYVQYGDKICAYSADENAAEGSKIVLDGQLDDAITKILDAAEVTVNPEQYNLTGFVGLSMASTGNIIATLNIGIAVIDVDLIHSNSEGENGPSGISFVPFQASVNPEFTGNDADYPAYEEVSNSICIDENDGIYVVSSINTLEDANTPGSLGFIRKLVLNEAGELFIDEGDATNRELGA